MPSNKSQFATEYGAHTEKKKSKTIEKKTTRCWRFIFSPAGFSSWKNVVGGKIRSWNASTKGEIWQEAVCLLSYIPHTKWNLCVFWFWACDSFCIHSLSPFARNTSHSGAIANARFWETWKKVSYVHHDADMRYTCKHAQNISQSTNTHTHTPPSPLLTHTLQAQRCPNVRLCNAA